MDLLQAIEQKKGIRIGLREQLNSIDSQIEFTVNENVLIEQAQSIIQIVAQQTQQKVKEYIENLVTISLQSVFDDPYEFVMEFVIRRGKTEVDLFFKRDGELFKPSGSVGGGIIDLTSFILRICFLTLLPNNEKNRTIILDEPFKWISKNYIDKAGELLQKLSKDLGYQFIFITHISELLEFGDRIFTVENRLGQSIVEVSDGNR
jgi:hypothetical protein